MAEVKQCSILTRIARFVSFTHQGGGHVPAPSQIPIACSAHTLYLAELAADTTIFFHGIGGFTLQFEDTFTTVLTFYGEDFIYRSIQVINAGVDYFGRGCIHIVPIVTHHVGACVQGTCGTPGDASGVVTVPSQWQAILGCAQVLVNLFVYLLSSGFGDIGIGSLDYFNGYQGNFTEGTHQVEVTVSTEEEGFALGTDIFGIVLVFALLYIVQDFIALVDDFIVLAPVCAQRTVGSSILEVIVHCSLLATVTGITAFLRIFTAYHVYHESGDTCGDIITTHQVVDIVHLSAYKGVGSVVFRELSQWVAVQEVITSTE